MGCGRCIGTSEVTKSQLARLGTESDACFQLLGRLAHSQVLARAIGPRTSPQPLAGEVPDDRDHGQREHQH